MTQKSLITYYTYTGETWTARDYYLIDGSFDYAFKYVSQQNQKMVNVKIKDLEKALKNCFGDKYLTLLYETSIKILKREGIQGMFNGKPIISGRYTCISRDVSVVSKSSNDVRVLKV